MATVSGSAECTVPGSADGATPGNAECIGVALGQFGAVIGCGLRQVLTDDREVSIVGEDLDHAALERVIAERAPRVVVLSEASVAEPSVCERLCAVRPGVVFVVIAQWSTHAYGARLLASGVAACLSIDASAAEIRSAIRLVANGQQVLAHPQDRSLRVAHVMGIASLTAREREVLRLLSLGEANATIAERLTISIETARTHVKSILRKLRVKTRRELVGVAIPEHFG
jgi:DNA-binding NarL/FixJ family response regulator